MAYDDKKLELDHIEGITQVPSPTFDEKVELKSHEQYVQDAINALEMQKTQTIKEALWMYTPAMAWSVIFSSAIIMEGYDTLLLGQFWAQPAFTQRYGEFVESSQKWEVPSRWQIALSIGPQVGSIIGLQLTGWASERLGYKKTMGMALVALTGFLFIQFFATNIQMLLAGYILLGFPWGTFQTLSVSYASEVMPIKLRPFLTTYVNLCWVIGQIIASGVSRALVDNETQWAYRIPYAIQWIWPVPILVGVIFAPESAWWLVRQGRIEDAERSVMRLTRKAAGFTQEDAKAQVALIQHTNQMELENIAGTNFWDCLKGTNLRRTEIVCVVWLIQVICGSPLMGNATYFFSQAGMAAATASTLNLIMFAVGGVGTMLSWGLMNYAGRRTIYLYGQVALSTLMAIVGIMGCITPTDSSRWAIGACLIIFTGLYDFTVGPVCYSLVAEIPATRVRAKSVILARNLYNVGGLIVGIINPKMLNSGDWNWGPKSAFLWLGTGVIGIVWTWFRLPEPKNRSYGELDILFEDKVPARKFARTKVDEFEAEKRNAALGGGLATGGAVH